MEFDDYTTIIPTTGRRAEALGRAVRSALAQTLPPSKIVIVIDGEEEIYRNVRTTAPTSMDIHLQFVRNLGRQGAASARMAGVSHVSTPLVAFLDDDDEWLPEKMETQLKAMHTGLDSQFVVALSAVYILSEHASYVLPRRFPRSGEDLAHYLYRAPNAILPNAYVATPSLVVSTALLEEEPFDAEWRTLEDIEWLIRATRRSHVKLVYARTPLVRVDGRNASSRGSLASQSNLEAVLRLANDRLEGISPRLARNLILASGTRHVRSQKNRAQTLLFVLSVAARGPWSPTALFSAVLFSQAPRRIPESVRDVLHRIRQAMP